MGMLCLHNNIFLGIIGYYRLKFSKIYTHPIPQKWNPGHTAGGPIAKSHKEFVLVLLSSSIMKF